MKDFKEFLLRGNLVDLAVGVVIGIAFAAVISALVADLITPLIAAIGGKPDFGSLSFTINGSHFLYGHFINALITFVVIAAVVFYLVIKPVNALMARWRTGAARRGGDQAVPGVPERDPARRAPLRVLHRGGGGGRLAGRVAVLAHQVVELLPRQRPGALRLAGLPVDRAAADLHDAEPFPVARHDDLDVDVPDRQLVIDLQTD